VTKIKITKHEVLFLLKYFMKFILLATCVVVIGSQIISFNKILIPSESKFKNLEKIELIKSDLRKLGASEEETNELSVAIKLSSDATNINDKLLSALMYTESRFKKNAISPKGYKGPMQTKVASFDYPEVDTLMGAKVLQEKLRYSNGNLELALALYKGGNNSQAKKQAKEVIFIYKKLISKGGTYDGRT